jgi:hypothetical protein
MTEDGALFHDIKIDMTSLQNITFPTSNYEDSNTQPGDFLGSAVVYVNYLIKNVPIIIAVLTKGDETQALSENEFQLFKSLGNALVLISGHGDTGELNINVIGDDGGGDLNINLSNSNKSASLNLNVNGDVNISVDGDVNIQNTGNVVVNTEGLVDVTADTILLGGNQGLVIAPGLPPGSPIGDISQCIVATKIKGL